MASQLMQNKIVQYLCGCGKWRPIYRLYICRHCLKFRCGDCILHEVDSPFCPNCLESMPSTEAKLKKQKCLSCFDCPSCGHTLTTRATSQMVSNPDDPGKSVPKKMYYLACGFCRWTTRDVGVADKSSASGAWEDLENPHSQRISALLEFYQQLSQKERLEQERKKYVRRRSHLMYGASIDKYGLVSVAAKRKNLLTGGPPALIKENEEAVTQTVREPETVEEFPPLSDDIFSQPLQLAKKSTISQRHANPQFQPAEAEDLYPNRKNLLTRKSLRCRECEHNLSKPEFNPMSIKFKIQLVGFVLWPEIRLVQPPELRFKKDTKVVLAFMNPAEINTKLQFIQPEGNMGEKVTAKVELPKKELTIGPRDDASRLDRVEKPQEFKDDSSVIAFRKANKIGVFFKVTPQVQDGDVKICFVMKHTFRNNTTALSLENPEDEIVWLEHRIMVNLGPVSQTK